MNPLLIATSLAFAGPLQPSAATAPAGEAPIAIGTTYRIHSAILGDDREINIRLPTGYDRGTRAYPVVYLLDGARDQDFDHIAGLAQLADLSFTFGPFILVGVQTRDRRSELTAPPTDPRYLQDFPESGHSERFRSFLADEVFPFVAGRFRIQPRRAVMGESLAGLFVVETFLKRPELFDDYIAVSPSLWWDDRADMRRLDRWLKPNRLANRRLFLAVADEGGTMQWGVDRLRAALSSGTWREFDWKYVDRSASETHATVYHGAALDAFRWLYAAPPFDYGPTPWYMIEGASPPSSR